MITSLVFVGALFAHAERRDVAECRVAGEMKIRRLAGERGAVWLDDRARVLEVDGSWFDPWVTVWFAAEAVYPDGGREEIRVRTARAFLPPHACE